MSQRSRAIRVAFGAFTALIALSLSAQAAEPTVRDLLSPHAEQEAQAARGDASAQPADAPAPAAEPEPAPALPAGATPRSAVAAYLDACRDRDYERAAEFLELPQRLRANAAERARDLRVVLDRTLWIDLDELSDAPEGFGEDGLPASQDRIGVIDGPGDGATPVLLERSRVGGAMRWRFSDTTLAKLPELYEVHGYGALGRVLPAVFFETRPFGVELWQWIGMMTLILVAAAAAWIGARIAIALLRPLLRRLHTGAHDAFARALGPLRLMIGLAVFSAASFLLHLSVQTRAIVSAIEAFLLIGAISWVFLRIADFAAEVLRARLVRQGQGSLMAVIPPGRKTVKALIWLVAGIALLDRLGFNVTALVAGLGVGGIAVALAAQKSLENLFGALMLFGDRPVRVGDFCRFGDRVGTVEDIGLRSTRVRTLDRTVVAIPNADFAALPLENFARRDRIWFHPTLGLRYETTPDQLRFVLSEIRGMLLAHPKVNPEPARVRFIGFGAYTLDVEVFAYVDVADFDEYLAIAEDLNLRIMEIVSDAGTGFAFPSQTTYLEKGEGIDVQRARDAERRVATGANGGRR